VVLTFAEAVQSGVGNILLTPSYGHTHVIGISDAQVPSFAIYYRRLNAALDELMHALLLRPGLHRWGCHHREP